MAPSERAVFFYEGRTIRGLGLMGWALLIELVAVVASGVTLAVLGVLLGPALVNPGGYADAILGVVAAVCGIELAEVAMGILFLVGFVDVHKGRNEYGLVHSRAIDRATACIVGFAALSAFSTLYTISMNLLAPPVASVPAQTVLTGNLIFSPLGALVAGLGLYYSVRALVDDPERRRLRAAAVLGVTGAALGPILLAFPPAVSPHDVSAVVTGLLASAVAGNGICALSLALFLLLYREVRRNLVAGRPVPSLPRFAPVYPWAWPTPPPTVAPPGPVEPPKSRE